MFLSLARCASCEIRNKRNETLYWKFKTRKTEKFFVVWKRKTFPFNFTLFPMFLLEITARERNEHEHEKPAGKQVSQVWRIFMSSIRFHICTIGEVLLKFFSENFSHILHHRANKQEVFNFTWLNEQTWIAKMWENFEDKWKVPSLEFQMNEQNWDFRLCEFFS